MGIGGVSRLFTINMPPRALRQAFRQRAQRELLRQKLSFGTADKFYSKDRNYYS